MDIMSNQCVKDLHLHVKISSKKYLFEAIGKMSVESIFRVASLVSAV